MSPFLQGRSCTIRPLRCEDAEARVRYLNMHEIERMMMMLPKPYMMVHHIAFIERLGTDRSLFVRVIDIDGDPAGGIGLHEILPGHKATLGYWLAPHHWGKGIMTEAISLFTNEAAQLFQLARIQAYVFAYNPASSRVLEKNGFLCEGRLRNDVRKDGQIFDRFIYSRLYG